MNYQEKYQKAKQSGYSDQEIMEYLGTKDPEFEQKMLKAQEAGYSPEQVLGYFNSPPRPKDMGALDYAADVGKQGAQGFGIGAVGTYGDILDLLHLQAKETLPGEQIKRQREFGILEKVDQGQVPSLGELHELSDDEILPRFSRLPSSQDAEAFGKELGAVSEPQSAAGRYARRIGKIAGSFTALGSPVIKAPIVAGLAGQTLEELGAPPWMQAAAEIIATLKFAPKSNAPITSKSKEVEKTIKDLRKAGYSEQDITLAKAALEESKILKQHATLTPKIENTIQKGVKNSEALFKEQIQKGLPGYAEGGLPYLERQASNVYQTMEDLASNIVIKNKEPVRKAINESIAYLEKFPLLDEQKKFIEFMKDGLGKLDKAEMADFFTGFYRNLGKAGNWGDPKQKEHLLTLVKDGIKQSFAESGPEAAKFGKYFEATNEAWKHWLDARDLMQNVEKTFTVDGMNFKKLSSMLNNPENHDLAKKILGPERLENIKTINKGAEAIESLLKQIKPAGEVSKSIRALEAVRALLTGSWKTLSILIGIEGAKMLSRKMLFDPKYQNITKKLINAAKNNSPKQAAILAQELVEDAESGQNNSGKKS